MRSKTEVGMCNTLNRESSILIYFHMIGSAQDHMTRPSVLNTTQARSIIMFFFCDYVATLALK